MREGRRFALVSMAALAVLIVGLSACSTGPTEEELAAEKAQEDWSTLESMKAELDDQRAELAALNEQIRARASEAADEVAEEGAETIESLRAKADELDQTIKSGSDELMNKIVEFINEQGMEVGVEPTGVQLSAIRMKSDEEIEIAKEYITAAGDYGRAIDIYQTALGFDPNNEKLQAALAQAEVDRFMTKERFAQVEKKMTQDEVRALIGQVKRQRIREYEDENAVGWFYEKEDTGAAGVFFRESKVGRGDWKVYHTDFEAIKPQEDAS